MIMGKGFDTHGARGPWITTPDEAGDVSNMSLKCWVNGELRQNGNTGEMIFDVAAQIEHLTKAFALEPGDLIFTGTPAGVGAAFTPPKFVKVGDTVRVEVERLGVDRGGDRAGNSRDAHRLRHPSVKTQARHPACSLAVAVASLRSRRLVAAGPTAQAPRRRSTFSGAIAEAADAGGEAASRDRRRIPRDGLRRVSCAAGRGGRTRLRLRRQARARPRAFGARGLMRPDIDGILLADLPLASVEGLAAGRGSAGPGRSERR